MKGYAPGDTQGSQDPCGPFQKKWVKSVTLEVKNKNQFESMLSIKILTLMIQVSQNVDEKWKEGNTFLKILNSFQLFCIFCSITGFFQDGICLEIHIFSTQFYICIDNIYIKEKFDIKIGHICVIYWEFWLFKANLSTCFFIFTTKSFYKNLIR